MNEPAERFDITLRPEGITHEQPTGRKLLTLIFPFSGQATPEWLRHFADARRERQLPQPTTIWGGALHVHQVENEPQRIWEATMALRADVQRANEACRLARREFDATVAEAQREATAANARA